jgi:hypothetical protein
MGAKLLHHGVFVEEEAHVGYDDVVDVGEEFVGRVVSELSGSEGEEPSDSAEQS